MSRVLDVVDDVTEMRASFTLTTDDMRLNVG